MRKPTSAITHDQICRALRQFERSGGHVVPIPPQPTPWLGRVLVHPQLAPDWPEQGLSQSADREAVAAALG